MCTPKVKHYLGTNTECLSLSKFHIVRQPSDAFAVFSSSYLNTMCNITFHGNSTACNNYLTGIHDIACPIWSLLEYQRRCERRRNFNLYFSHERLIKKHYILMVCLLAVESNQLITFTCKSIFWGKVYADICIKSIQINHWLFDIPYT